MRWINGLKARVNGIDAEHRAMLFLEKEKLTFVTANYRCRMGEIDLVMKEKEQLIFVEVKSRQNEDYGHAAEYVTKTKRVKLEKAINHYLLANQLNPYNTDYRMDVVAITGDKIDWFQAI